MSERKSRPILFSGEMVKAILEGRKTMTRRVIKPQPVALGSNGWYEYCHGRRGKATWHGDTWRDCQGTAPIEEFCPYGQPGDRLWARETWRIVAWDEDFSDVVVEYKDGTKQYASLPFSDDNEIQRWSDWLLSYVDKLSELPGVTYDSAKEQFIFESLDVIPWRPSIFMPRWASRITLEVTGIKVERVQDISEEDAMAEGVEPNGFEPGMDLYPNGKQRPCARSFAFLWDSINLSRGYSWDSNPYVWCVSFREID